MKIATNFFAFACLAAASSFAASDQADPKSCPLHAEHMAQAAAQQSSDKGEAELAARGDRAMGFQQSRSAHHFRLLANGGAIEVTANELADSTTREQIRQHLAKIAQQFALGDFSSPLETHAQLPPGVEAMRLLKSKISYQYQPRAQGGSVTIASSDAGAVAAIHDFLRFQIREHRTGDPAE